MNLINLQIKSGGASAEFDPAHEYRAVAWSGAAPDRSGEQFDANTFDLSTLTRHPLPLLKNHDHGEIVGAVIAAEVVGVDLEVVFKLIDTEAGRLAAAEIAGLALNCLSVGYILRPDGQRELLEVSLTPVPMHPGAVITERAVDPISTRSPDPAPTGSVDPVSADPLEKTAMTGPAIHTRKQAPFSVSKMLLGLTEPTFSDWGYEREVSQETARLSGKSSSTPMVPWGALVQTKAAPLPQDSVTAPSGNPATDPGQSLARPINDDRLFTITAGADFLPTFGQAAGVNQHFADAGKFYAPRLVGNVKPDWVARDADVPKVGALFDSVESRPHTLGGVAEVRRSALIDCTPAMDAFLLQQLRLATVAALDSALIGNPAGAAANAPSGLLSQVADGGAIADFAALQKLLRKVEYLIGRRPTLAFGPYLRDYLDSNPTGTGLTVPAGLLLPDNPASLVASQLDLIDPTKSFVLAGDFGYVHEVLYGGGIELSANPYSSTVYAKGGILLRTLVDADVLITDPSRFTRGAMAVK